MSSKDIQVLTDDDQFPIDCPTQLDTVQYTVKEKKAAFPAPPQSRSRFTSKYHAIPGSPCPQA